MGDLTGWGLFALLRNPTPHSHMPRAPFAHFFFSMGEYREAVNSLHLHVDYTHNNNKE